MQLFPYSPACDSRTVELLVGFFVYFGVLGMFLRVAVSQRTPMFKHVLSVYFAELCR